MLCCLRDMDFISNICIIRVVPRRIFRPLGEWRIFIILSMNFRYRFGCEKIFFKRLFHRAYKLFSMWRRDTYEKIRAE